MVNKSSLAKKLASYSALAAAVLAIDKTADAQIIYTPVKPAFVGSDTTYNLDLNNDGIVDFKIVQTHATFFNSGTNYSFSAHGGEYLGAVAMSSNALIGKPFYYGSAINANNVGFYGWAKGQSFEYGKWREWGNDGTSFNSGGPWNFNQDTAYVPLKLVDNGNTYYGWVRLYAGSFTVTGYAYNSVPDSGIYAGQECNIQFPIPTISQNGTTLTTTANNKIQWYYNNVAIANDTTTSISVSQNGIYAVTTGDTSICHGTSPAFDYLNCGTLSPPIITTANNAICVYYNAVLNADTNTIPKYYSIQWLKNDSIIEGETGTNLSTNLPGNYSIVMTELGGCTDTSNVLRIIADTLPILNPAIKEIGDTLFSNFTIRNKWNWNGDTMEFILPLQNQVYQLTVSDNLGCKFYSEPFTYVNCSTYHPKLSSSAKAYCANFYTETNISIDTVPFIYGEYWYLNDSLIGMGYNQGYNIGINIAKPGTYFAIVEEPGGCIDTTNAIYLKDDSLISPVITKQGNDSLISSYTTGNVWETWYMTLTNDSEQVFLPTQSGTYWVVYTDSLGCQAASTEFSFIDCKNFVLPISSSSNPICFDDSTTLNVLTSGTYTWKPTNSLNIDTGLTVIASPTITTTYYVTGTNSFGCILSNSITVTVDNCHFVWPGDANEDLVVNNFDLLPIGLYYGYTGPSRDTTTNAWAPHLAKEWDSLQTNGMNRKFVDCNGDGTINSDDTLAVTLNYGLTHPFDSPTNTSTNNDSTVSLYFVSDTVNYLSGNKVHAEVWVGNKSKPIQNIYALAYDINIDTSYIQPGTLSFVSDSSFMGVKNKNVLTLTHIGNDVETVIAGIDHLNKNGYGKIGDLHFTLSNNAPTSDLVLSFSSYEAVDASGNLDTLYTSDVILIINNPNAGIGAITGHSEIISIYPNPATNQLSIISNNLQLMQIQIENELGQIVLNKLFEKPLRKQTLDINTLPAGMYFYMITTKDEETITGKFVKE